MNAKPYQTVLPFSLLLLISACNNPPAPADGTIAMNSTTELPVSKEDLPPIVNDPHAHLRKKPEIHNVDPKRDTVLHIGQERSQIHIPKDAFVFEDGRPVTTPVEIKFVEYRNAADIVFSSLPMTYSSGGENFQLNSAGMFEINGACDGKAVAIAGNKELNIDYALAQKPADMGFFVLDEKTNNWQLLEDLKPEKKVIQKDDVKRDNKAKAEPQALNKREQQKVEAEKISEKAKRIAASNKNLAIESSAIVGLPVFQWTDDKGKPTFLEERVRYEYEMGEDAKKYLCEHPNHYLEYDFDIDTLKKKLVNIHPHELNPFKGNDKAMVSYLEKLPAFDLLPTRELGWALVEGMENGPFALQFACPDVRIEMQPVMPVFGQQKFDPNAPFISPSYTDPGHTYPDVVLGLSVRRFGIYNCDQAYRLQNRITVAANFVDENKADISDATVLSLVDLQYNAAYSYDPRQFVCDPRSRNVLVLFTKSGKLYLLDEKSFRKANVTATGTTTLVMKDMSDKIKNSDDLAKVLGIDS